MSAMTLQNETPYLAQFVVRRGDLVIARLPGLAPNATLQVPTDDTAYEVTATTELEGNTLTSAPATLSRPAAFLAQIRQNAASGTYDFELIVSDSTLADRLEFQKTTLGPVTFLLSRNGIPLQSIVVEDSFLMRTVAVGSAYSIYAVINGVTTDTATTSNANATVTAIVDRSVLEAGYFTLKVAA